MTYVKCTNNNIKILSGVFWVSALLVSSFFVPMLLIPVGLLGLFHLVYLMLDPLPLPVVLSFISMIVLSAYTVYMNISHMS